jgi:hypothetical protein
VTDTKIDSAVDVIRRAIADPGTHTPRGNNYGEPLPSWQAREVLAALEAHDLAVVDRATADDAHAAERAHSMAELRAMVAEVRGIHTEFKIYEECRHAEHDDDTPTVVVNDLGEVCASGYLYSICRSCCAPGDSQTEDCVDNHDHTECWPCPTRLAVDEPATEETDTTEETP